MTQSLHPRDSAFSERRVSPDAEETQRHCAMSIDVEEYFQVWAFSDAISRKSWDGFGMRVAPAVHRILDMLDENNARATFFVLGWVADRAPDLIRDIVARGHELASHGYDHAKVFGQTQEQFRADVVKTRNLLEDIAGVRVSGYRAPGFSIDTRTPWAYDVLAEAGYLYSSSAHPIAHDHYGDPSGERSAYHPIKGSGFVEAPVATAQLFGRRISCAGGGWFRATPYPVAKKLFAQSCAQLSGPAIFYFHPWEIDPEQPRIKSAPLKSKLRHYLNLKQMEPKLRQLLRDFSWTRIDESLGAQPVEAAA